MLPFLPVLLGTTRLESQSATVARYLVAMLNRAATAETALVDLAELAIPSLESRLSEMAAPPEGLTAFAETLRRADGLVIVAPEYKNGYPGVLKNALDHLERNIFRHKPIGICTVSSGNFGGVNCLAQLRLVCLAMGGLPIPATLPIAQVQDAFDTEGLPRTPRLVRKVDVFLEEVRWYTEALVQQRSATPAPV